MNTNPYVSILASASLLAATALAGCDAGQETDPYAEADEQAEPAGESYGTGDAGEATEPDTMDRSVASERPGATGMQSSPQEPAMTGESSTAMGESAAAMEGELTESAVVGQSVVTGDGEEIGTIVQVVEGTSGEGRFAVVDVGEFLGIGEKQVAIDIRQLSLGPDGEVRSDVSADSLESMPEYEPASDDQETSENTPE